MIAVLLEKEVASNSDGSSRSADLVSSYGGNTFQASQDIYHSMQITLEFMDKGMKGMLSGDLSTFAVKQVEQVIEGALP